MIDKTPVISPSEIPQIAPPMNSSSIHRKRPKITKQLGLSAAYEPYNEGFIYSGKPSTDQLSAWDEARRKEPLIKQGLEFIVLAVLAKIGSYNHPDSKIDDYVQSNLNVFSYKKHLSDLLHSLLFSGYACSEIIWEYYLTPNKEHSHVWIKDLINFHPLQIEIILDKYGGLNDGAASLYSNLNSGVWVPCPVNKDGSYSMKVGADFTGSRVRLKRNKRVFLTLGGEGNNPYGRSQLESVLPYHLFKEAYRDMLTTALDRYGTPLVYVIVPPLNTKEQIEEEDGSIRFKTLHEKTVEQIQELSSEAALVFTQVSKDQPVTVDALTTGNNFSDAFTQAIELCDENMLMGLGIPNLLFKDKGRNLGSGGASESQLEVFNSFISSLYDLTVVPFTQQVILPLIQYNFDPLTNPLAYDAGHFVKKPSRSSELKVIIDSIKSLTESKYISPSNPSDNQYVRDLTGFPPPVSKKK